MVDMESDRNMESDRDMERKEEGETWIN